MSQTRIFNINGKDMELPLYQKGDRVRCAEGYSTTIGIKGTVESTKNGGLFVDVTWDQDIYYFADGDTGSISVGSSRLVNSIKPLEGDSSI